MNRHFVITCRFEAQIRWKMAKRFGGNWMQRKLDVVESYLKTCLTALSKQKFSLGYVDAFAGDGSLQLATSDATLFRHYQFSKSAGKPHESGTTPKGI